MRIKEMVRMVKDGQLYEIVDAKARKIIEKLTKDSEKLGKDVNTLNESLGTLFDIYNPSGTVAFKADVNQVLQSDNLIPYYVNADNGTLNLPQGVSWGILINYIVAYAPNYVIMQLLISNTKIYKRQLVNNSWSEWV